MDVLRLLTQAHAFATRVDLWSPEIGYLYAEYDRILISNDDIILSSLRDSSTPRVVSLLVSDDQQIGSLLVENPDGCGMIFNNKWLEQNSTDISCFMPLFSVKNAEMFWPLENKELALINKVILRIRPHAQKGNLC